MKVSYSMPLYDDLYKCYKDSVDSESPKITLDQFRRIYKNVNKPFPAVFEGINTYKDFEQLINTATNPKDPIATNKTENV